MDGTEKVGVSVLAQILGLTVARVNSLVSDGVLTCEGRPRKYVVKDCVQAYINYVAGRFSPKSDDQKSIDKKKAKAEADLKRAKADQEQLKLKELRGQMHRSEDVEAATNQLVYTIRSMMLALPGRLAVDTAAAKTAAETSNIIEAEVFNMLEELETFEYDPAIYAEMVREREGWMGNDIDRSTDDA